MKNLKLRELLREAEQGGVDDDSFINLNMEIYLNYRGGASPDEAKNNSSCQNNSGCGSNLVCSNNQVCDSNHSCSGNTQCGSTPS